MRARGAGSGVISRGCAGARTVGVGLVLAVARDAEQHADRGHHHDQRRAAVADEGQRDAGERDRARDAADVDQGLEGDPADDAHRQVAAEVVAGVHGDAEAAVDEIGEEADDDHGADEARLLADDREDAVGVGAGDVEELLAADAEAEALRAAAAEGDQQLQRLEADAGRVVLGAR